MPGTLKIGIIGDYNPASRYHRATDAALQHSAAALGVEVEAVWLPTPSLEDERGESGLAAFDALWCSPGSPYASMEGALAAIRYARKQGKPFVGA